MTKDDLYTIFQELDEVGPNEWESFLIDSLWFHIEAHTDAAVAEVEQRVRREIADAYAARFPAGPAADILGIHPIADWIRSGDLAAIREVTP